MEKKSFLVSKRVFDVDLQNGEDQWPDDAIVECRNCLFIFMFIYFLSHTALFVECVCIYLDTILFFFYVPTNFFGYKKNEFIQLENERLHRTK